MKTLIAAGVLFLAEAMLNAREYKAVFDCSSGDARYVASRMAVVEETVRLIELKGDTAKIALTLHGGCVGAVIRNIEEILDADDAVMMEKARESITRLHENRGSEIVACAMSLDANGIDKSDVLPFVRISEDSFIDTIGYQNDGYAVMTF